MKENFNLINKKEGYSIVTIPEVTYKSCYGCKYYERRMVKSGLDPIYASNCNHFNAPMDYNFRGNLPSMFGNTETPDWCPVGEAKNNND